MARNTFEAELKKLKQDKYQQVETWGVDGVAGVGAGGDEYKKMLASASYSTWSIDDITKIKAERDEYKKSSGFYLDQLQLARMARNTFEAELKKLKQDKYQQIEKWSTFLITLFCHICTIIATCTILFVAFVVKRIDHVKHWISNHGWQVSYVMMMTCFIMSISFLIQHFVYSTFPVFYIGCVLTIILITVI